MVVTPPGLICRYSDTPHAGVIPDLALAQFRFDAHCENPPGTPVLSTGLQPLVEGIAGELLAVAGGPVTRGFGEQCYWAESDDYLFLALWADETDAAGLAAISQHLYQRLLGHTRARGYPHLVRMWNYFADINGETQGLERYRQFCLGRFDAFTAHGLAENQYPSACALGHGGGDLLVYALASKTTPWHFENPRQASAYHYPAEYGPRSPSFARASLLSLPGQTATLFVSGTASVVGYLTLHPYQLGGQIDVTLENLELLLAHVAQQYRHARGGNPQLKAEVLKVYIRNPADLAAIKARVGQAYPQAAIAYVVADICRADLLLEIDGIWNLLP
ncbi:chorismate transformation enzyme, FkbO/Hyg5 family [Cellvibrio japonicus]|uniref:FkbO protein n=1 Tax=Cellvibrio japonicus (strain Ueda107) TaxID=498211 RepID=B3PFI8_CELJU|nr:FkbO protein [Cellvibrio japonicus]ACE82656.1 FkbO protein [Cellvibrio japonicus Ueda107]QEI10855.1 hypothetical protein FY117_00495 [Cellvibrio japonicus]QEI14431.1 hypothetical protein FY116_00495 [Cellvibrio japonicus]QEI18009.1 hypothetical protein FY115_00495 [Cellvibrio japonicus]